MPTNFKRSFRRRVILKRPEDTCSWLRHFERGTCARSLWGHLESLDTVKKERFYFGSIKSLYANARKFRDKKVVGIYSPASVDKVLREWRKMGLITLQYENKDLHNLDGFRVADQPWHDARCHREGRYCFYSDDPLPPLTELGKKYPSTRVEITPKEKSALDATAEEDRAAALARIASGTDSGTDKITQGTDVGTDSGTDKIEKGYRLGYRPGQPEGQAIPIVVPPPEKLGSQFGAREAVEAVNQSLQAKEATEAATKGTEKATAEEDVSFSEGMTDQKQNLQPSVKAMTKGGVFRKPETIGEHFGSAVSISEISNDEIDWDGLDKKYRYTHISREAMESYCQAAVDAKADLPYLGPKTHGVLMIDAMLMLSEREQRKAPECWYPVARALRDNPPVFPSAVEVEEEAKAATSFWERVFEYAGVALDPAYQLPSCNLYRNGWEYLAGLPFLPEPLAKVRDWLWDADAMPDKAAIPPWSVRKTD